MTIATAASHPMTLSDRHAYCGAEEAAGRLVPALEHLHSALSERKRGPTLLKSGARICRMQRH